MWRGNSSGASQWVGIWRRRWKDFVFATGPINSRSFLSRHSDSYLLHYGCLKIEIHRRFRAQYCAQVGNTPKEELLLEHASWTWQAFKALDRVGNDTASKSVSNTWSFRTGHPKNLPSRSKHIQKSEPYHIFIVFHCDISWLLRIHANTECFTHSFIILSDENQFAGSDTAVGFLLLQGMPYKEFNRTWNENYYIGWILWKYCN